MTRLTTLFFAWIFPLFPKRMLSRATGLVMRLPLPPLLNVPLLKLFARIFHIDIAAAEKPLSAYRSFDDFFTRHLKPGLRPIGGPIVHPADAVLTAQGIVEKNQLVQAKGWTYDLAEFLGDPSLARKYEGGSFFTYYLCPTDYHRVHAMADGTLYSAKHIPGLLWPVNNWSVHNVRRLFNLNERVVLNFKSDKGLWSMVLVGATNVGHMGIKLDPSIITNRWMWHEPTERHYEPATPVHPGDEVGVFHLGSTVIAIFAPSFGLKPGDVRPTLMGASL